MAKAVQLDALVATAIDPTTVGSLPQFDVTQASEGDETHRPTFEGALDAAETIRVRAYVPASFSKDELTMTPAQLRDGKEGVKRSKDGRVNVSHFEDTDAGILVLMWSPVEMNPIEGIKLNFS